MALLDEIVGWAGGFQILRLTVKKRMRATLAIRDELTRRRHDPIRAQGQWLTWGGVWLLQLPRGAMKLEAVEWLQEGHMPILASGSRRRSH